ncbi:unnamed protein product [Dimorphilus gyrociliatus]|uniref:Guanine nucleotide-binding protein subunit gamma n=1 Tax=Dimorphilus gyrociliatus TaxID=2664684 RepID=A0A7I8V7M0_9ANNE|nr:unnamed protein product [Dimorphilus gyrociliatus]
MSNEVIEAQKKLVEQLKIESQVDRYPVSKTSEELVKYIRESQEYDPFLIGIDKKQNPFKEKSSCVVL